MEKANTISIWIVVRHSIKSVDELADYTSTLNYEIPSETMSEKNSMWLLSSLHSSLFFFLNFTRISFLLVAITLAPLVPYANAHSLLNSAESTIGDNRIQIATDPEIPATNQTAKILLHVTDLNLNDVERFKIGIRMFYEDKQVDGIPPQTIEGGYWSFDYVFKKPGNHIFRVDLYDTQDRVITHTFNMSTQNPFGYIFFYVIMSGAIGAAVIFGYIYLPKKLKRPKSQPADQV